MEEPFRFEASSVPSRTTKEVRQAFDADHGLMVYGPAGSGKTHAVSTAVNGAVWALVPHQPFAVPRLIADLAAQVGAGEAPTRAYLEDGCRSACEALDERLRDRPLVIDAADWLWMPADDPIFPDATAVWAHESVDFCNWLVERVARSRTVVVTRRRPPVPNVEAVKHSRPRSWTIKLVRSEPGFLDWSAVADRVANNPAALQMAATVLRFAGVRRMRLWLDDEDAEPVEAARGLGQLFRHHAPRPLIQILSLLFEAGELPRKVLDTVVTNGRGPSTTDDDLSVALNLATSLGLAEERQGILRAMPFLRTASAIPAIGRVGAEALVERVYQLVLSRVNDRSSLEPSEARAVLDAHRLQLAVRDFDGALTTARLHLGGLIMHARRLSLEADSPEEFDRARRAYASILQLMSNEPRIGQERTRSYVVHYHGFNGHRAHTLGLDRVAADYRDAVHYWHENALFHARRIALEVERGDLEQARSCLQAAYQQVPEHPRREAVLRVHPAGWVFRAGVPTFALFLLENGPSPDSLIDVDPEAFQILVRLHETWREKGIEVEHLETEDHRQVMFQKPVRFYLEETDAGWVARMDYPPAQAVGPGPWSAALKLAGKIADECVRLVSQPTGRLARHDVGTKGLFLGAIDLQASDIGLPHQDSLWLVGRVQEGRFVPTSYDLEELAISGDLAAEGTTEGMFFGRVPVDRSGRPDGPIDRLEPAGSGRTMKDLLRALRRLALGSDDAA